MVWHQRLRYRLIGIQLMVVLIGVGMMLLAMRSLIFGEAPDEIRGRILSAVGIAAVGALFAGAVASLLLWRTLVVPLRTLAANSQRIADGRYDERVPFPNQSGEAMQQLATNFNQMAGTLQRVEQQRVAMIGNVAHELRTPLAGLRGVVEGLEDGVFAADSQTFGMMGREIGRLSRLVDDIQNLSRVEAGAVSFDLQDFLLCEIARRVSLHLQSQAEEKGIALTVHEADPPLKVHADSDRTAQILTNLVGNAIRYTSADGTVTVKIQSVGNMAQVQVVDTGVGISADDLPYIFERFYRADRSRSRQSGGSGIGLTIARHLAWGMGGELSAESDGLNTGSTFTLTLPLAQ